MFVYISCGLRTSFVFTWKEFLLFFFYDRRAYALDTRYVKYVQTKVHGWSVGVCKRSSLASDGGWVWP